MLKSAKNYLFLTIKSPRGGDFRKIFSPGVRNFRKKSFLTSGEFDPPRGGRYRKELNGPLTAHSIMHRGMYLEHNIRCDGDTIKLALNLGSRYCFTKWPVAF